MARTAASSGCRPPDSSKSSSGLSERIQFSRMRRRCGFVLTSARGTWWERQKASIRFPSTSAGAPHPFGDRNTTIGQRGRVAMPLLRHTS